MFERVCVCVCVALHAPVCVSVRVGVSALMAVPERETRRHFVFSQPPFCQEKVDIILCFTA